MNESNLDLSGGSAADIAENGSAAPQDGNTAQEESAAGSVSSGTEDAVRTGPDGENGAPDEAPGEEVRLREEFEELINGRYKSVFDEHMESLARERDEEERYMRGCMLDILDAMRTDEAVSKYRGWISEADELKKEYPDFDIASESKDARFIALLKNGVDVRTAFTALHSDLVVAAALERARERMMSDIIKRGSRPPENGTSDQSAAVGKPDISALSRSEVEAIERRVARGEKIYLK